MITNWMKKIFDLPFKLKEYIVRNISLELLLFLILISNHRYYFKLIAISILILSNRNFSIRKDCINLFYVSVIAIGIINFFFGGDFTVNYTIVFICGVGFWVLNLIIHNQLSFLVGREEYILIYNTLKIFVFLNFLFSLVDLIQVMQITGTINPYAAITIPPPYGSMSGDLIRGFFGINHLPNACISGLFFVFFIYKKNFMISFVALLTVLITSSNLTVLLIITFLLFAIIIVRDIRIKYYSVLSFLIILIFYVKINPFNYYEILNTFKLADTNVYYKKTFDFAFDEENERNAKQKEMDSILITWNYNKKYFLKKHSTTSSNIKPQIIKEGSSVNRAVFHGKDSIVVGSSTSDSSNYITKSDIKDKEQGDRAITSDSSLPEIHETNIKDRLLDKNREQIKLNYYKIWSRSDSLKVAAENSEEFAFGNLKKFDLDIKPGHLISLEQTKDLLLRSPKHFLLGNGVGNYSSRIAMLSSKEKEDSRLFKIILPRYEHVDYRENHKAIWKYVNYLGTEYHSFIHLPFSGYNQLLGEYGVIGLLMFMLLYVGFFIKKWKYLQSGKILIGMLLIMFNLDYWFESLTLLVFFELLILIEVKYAEHYKSTKDE